MSLKESLKKIPALQPLVKGIKGFALDVGAIPKFLAERCIQRSDGPVRVGFLCQYLPAWTKIEPIYQQMRQDPRFEPVLIALPDDMLYGVRENPDDLTNPVYAYLLEKGYSGAINALVGKDTYLDLKTLKLEYLFYPRPYDGRIPGEYAAGKVSRYTKVCLIMYGMAFNREITKTTLNRGFMRYCWCYFAEDVFTRRTNVRRGWLCHSLGLQKSVCLGLPVLEALAEHKDEESPAWAFSQNAFRVLWTPRWTTDKAEGGSNFFTYYQRIVDYARENKDMDFLLRPHPLAFSNFISTGEMTPQQVEDYQARVAAVPNTSLDKTGQYEATLWNSSVMVSDISAIMPEFFITGKPLIFCASNMELTLTEFGKRLIEGCYSVYNEQELFSTLEMLKAGKDPKKELRQQILQEAFGGIITGATDRIVESLKR